MAIFRKAMFCLRNKKDAFHVQLMIHNKNAFIYCRTFYIFQVTMIYTTTQG